MNLELWIVHMPTADAGGYYHTSTADTDSWTELRRLH
jgi:hypothetical protein